MLALAIISTVMLGLLLLLFFVGIIFSEDPESSVICVGMLCLLSLIFSIVTIWVLYSH